MEYPTSRPYNATTLIDYCKRKLGQGMVEVNVTDEQSADRLSEALQFMFQFNYDMMQKVYIKHRISQQDVDNQYISLDQASGTATIANGSTTVTGLEANFTNDFQANVTSITINSETRTVAAIANQNSLTVNTAWTSNASGVPIVVTQASDRILGVTRIFPLGSSSSRISFFDYRFQWFSANVWDVASSQISNYALTREHMAMIEMLMVGDIPIRYTKHQNRLFIDTNWSERMFPGTYILIEAWMAIDPDSYSSIYNDIFLKRYLTALIKLQWAQNLSKFGGMPLPGGITVNFGDMMTKAEAEIEACQKDIRETYEEPPGMLVG